MTAVLGIDPSITETGIAAPDGSLTIVGGDAALGDTRLLAIKQCVGLIVAKHRPALAVIEDLPTHAHGAGITGMAQAAVRLALMEWKVPYALIPAASLKKYATGNGGANKSDMRMALYKRAGIDERNDNKVDAWWLRAMGCDWLGEPLVTVPQAHRAALDKVAWPSGFDEPPERAAVAP